MLFVEILAKVKEDTRSFLRNLGYADEENL